MLHKGSFSHPIFFQNDNSSGFLVLGAWMALRLATGSYHKKSCSTAPSTVYKTWGTVMETCHNLFYFLVCLVTILVIQSLSPSLVLPCTYPLLLFCSKCIPELSNTHFSPFIFQLCFSPKALHHKFCILHRAINCFNLGKKDSGNRRKNTNYLSICQQDCCYKRGRESQTLPHVASRLTVVTRFNSEDYESV